MASPAVSGDPTTTLETQSFTTTTTNDLTLDNTETSLGICAYRTPTVPGFSGVLKGRFSDFLVHEVGLDGTRAELTALDDTIILQNSGSSSDKPLADDTTAESPASSDGRKRKRADDDPTSDQLPSTGTEDKQDDNDDDDKGASPALDWVALEMELDTLLKSQPDIVDHTDGCARKVVTFLQKEPDTATKYVCIRSSNDKRHRRALHEWIRAKLSTHTVADTAQDEKEGYKVIRLWNPQFAKEMPNYGKFDPSSDRRRRQQQRPPTQFLRFVLYKENLDTNSALHQIQRRCGGGGGRGGRGGKHRRSHHNQPSLRLGFAGMKDKRGITTQFVTMPARSSVESMMWAINPRPRQVEGDQVGGGHTDGGGASVMRIGNFTFVDEDLRLGRLQGNRFDVVLRNIQYAKNGRDGTKEVLKNAAISLGKAGFINYFGVQRFGKYCDTHLVGIAMLKKDYAGAVDLIMLPKPDERENTTNARQAWKNRFSELSSDATERTRAEAERDCAKRILKDFGRFMNNEIAILKSLANNPLDYRRALGCVAKTMRMMFVHALQSLLFNHAATFRMQTWGDQVVEGDLVPDGPLNVMGYGMPKLRKATAHDVEQKRYSIEDVFLPLVGSKTMEPDIETAKVYSNRLTEYGLTVQSFDQDERDLNCAGDYRRLLIRPADVDFDVLEYTDPRQPLMQTDLMKIQGISIEQASSDAKDVLLAMRVGFTLPSSAYATIALRELMKRPTSSDYQKDLSLGE